MKVTLIAAQSLDGFITRHDKPGSGFTSQADKAYFSRALAGFDCWIMGGESYRQTREAVLAGLAVPKLRRIVTRDPGRHRDDARPPQLEFTDLPPKAVLAELDGRACRACAVLGGAEIYGLYLKTQVIDEIWLTVEPVLFGSGRPLVGGMSLDVRMRLLSEEKLAADTLLLKYEVVK